MTFKKLVMAAKDRYTAANLGGADIFAGLAAAFTVSSLIFVSGGSFTDLAYVRQSPACPYIILIAAVFSVLSALSLLLKSAAPIKICLAAASLSLCAVLCVQEGENIYFCLGLALILALEAKYIFQNSLPPKTDLSRKASLIITAGIFLLFFAFVFFCTAAKYNSFKHSTFDFGIFAQMFEQMAKCGAPVTTVERSEALSHFAVHFSPVFYLLLPGYMIFRSPLYLLCAQAAIVGAGVFPIRRICLSLGMSQRTAVAAAALYAVYPTMANGCFYDFHENKFLAVFLLYMISFALEKKRVGVIVFALLILSVKEDAFIYVLAVCLWMLVTGRDRKTALLLSAVGVGYFFFACGMIRLCGGEIMSGRFANYSVSGNGGLFDAVKTCFLDIGYLIREVFSGADTEAFREITYGGQKLEFVLWTALPLLFTPFLRKHGKELVLLIPLLVINLMPSWMYQYDIDFQYTFGTAALMIASALMFLSEVSERRRHMVLCAMLMISIVLSVSAVGGKAQSSVSSYFSNKDAYDSTAAALREEIPKGASVTAYGYMVPHLYYIDNLRTCPEYYSEYEKTDFYVIDKRYETDKHTPNMLRAMGDDYTLVRDVGFVKIYKLKN